MPDVKPPRFSRASFFGNVQGDLLRVQPIMHIARTIGELGGDAGRIFSEEGIPGDLFSNPENSISMEAIGRLLDRCAAETGCDHFGLLLGAGSIDNPFGLLGEVIEHCADVGTAIAYFQQFYHLHDRGGMAVRTIEGQVTSLGYIVFRLESPSLKQINDTAIAVGMVLMRHLCGPKWRPTTVLLPRHRPADVHPYRNVFRCTPEFNAKRAALVFPTQDLERPIAGADSQKYAMLSERLQTISSEHDLKFADQVSRVVRGMIALRRSSMEHVSALLGINQRRVNRLLEREGTTYRRIVQEALCTLAERLLVDTDKSIGEISVILDYADASVFSRAFRKWHGCPPSEWRRAQKK